MVNTSLTASHGDIYDISIKKEYSTDISIKKEYSTGIKDQALFCPQKSFNVQRLFIWYMSYMINKKKTCLVNQQIKTMEHIHHSDIYNNYKQQSGKWNHNSL